MFFNWPPARIFMGDVGSTWLAFMIFALALFSIQAGWLTYAVWAVAGAVFVTDATVMLLTRMLRRERWYEAHRSHAYQLVRRKWEVEGRRSGLDAVATRASAHRRATLGVLAINLFWLAPLAVTALLWRDWAWYLVGVAYLPLVAGALFLGAGRPDHVVSGPV